MYKPLAYLKFNFTATNRHGVHSPFVYRYLTNCLYTKAVYRGNKSIDVLLKSMLYFRIQRVLIPEKYQELIVFITNNYPKVVVNTPPYNLVYCSLDEWLNTSKDDLNSEFEPNDSMILLEGIYTNNASNRLWKAFVLDEQFHVSIDMFHCGALFFRKEQHKEHFKVRI